MMPPTTAIVCEAPADVFRLLAANKAAMTTGRDVPSGTIVRRYAYETSGLVGTLDQTFDLATGAYVVATSAGLVRGVRGFDGRQAWLSDLSGFSSLQGGGNTRASAIDEAFRNASTWWRPKAGAARVKSIGCGGIEITPDGGQSFQAWFDPRTHRLSRIVEPGSYGATIETRYFDYRLVQGRETATRVETVTNGDRGTLEVRKLESASLIARRPANDYARPRLQPSDWTMPSTRRVTLPFRTVNNHVIVDVLVNGRGPYPFLVDTGGHDIVTPAIIEELSISSERCDADGWCKVTRRSTAGFARIESLSIGGVVLHDQTVLTLDFSPLSVEGIRLGGMLGVEFMERFVVRLDYGTKMMTITDRTLPNAVERDSAVAVPFQLYEHMPQVLGDFDGRPARFDIDTGARGEVTLTSPFVRNAGLRNAYPGGVTVTDGWGVGGPSRAYVVRARELRMADVTVDRPLSSLSLAAKGSFSDTNYEGNIGSGLLKRFSVTFRLLAPSNVSSPARQFRRRRGTIRSLGYVDQPNRRGVLS